LLKSFPGFNRYSSGEFTFMSHSRQIALGLAIAGALLGVPTLATAQVCGTAEENFDAGQVTISNDASNLYVRYNAASPWVISDTHVAVASTLSGIPQTKAGNPIPGRFAYSGSFDPEVTTDTVAVPMAGTYSSGQTVYIAAHAQVQAPKANGGAQTGWGYGPDFPGPNWATYIKYTIQSCNGGGID
jgi:hypothetical protein